MSREIYATPILLGCVLYIALRTTALDRNAILVVAVAIILCIRAAAIRWTSRCRRG